MHYDTAKKNFRKKSRLRPAAFLTMVASVLIFLAPVAFCITTPTSSILPSGEDLAAFQKELASMGFSDVQEIDANIRVELKYAVAENFMGVDVYGDFHRGYLRREAAEKLAKANALLRHLRPGFSLLLVDGLRPRRVQKRMWEIVKDTPMRPYVATPHTGSMHNYGCAVDLTIVDDKGQRLDMGTPMDHFGILSQPRMEKIFLKQGKLTPEQVSNRRLLRRVMVSAGFRPLPIEWWHFDAFEKGHIRKTYSIVE